MGRASRWLKGLFGIKKDKHSSNSGRDTTNGLCHNPATIPPNISPAEASWLKSFYSNDSNDQQNRHAIAVAAATAAAADAAVAAAQAAVAVVRLTSQGRNSMSFRREKLAAIKIQSLFRGYLSRKALRALKGLVKLQALVRGYLVRKQAAATLYSMQALIRAQSSVRAHKIKHKHDRKFHSSPFQHRKSIERFEDTRSEYTTSIHSRRLSASFETPTNGIDENPKIVEVDPGRPKSRSRRTNTWASDSGDCPYAQSFSSPLPHQLPPRLSIPNSQNPLQFDWCSLGEEYCRLSTPQSTPRFANSCGSNGRGSVTPAKSVCVDAFFGPYPNYMANTKSSKAKLRSHSAPKQRPEFWPKKRVSLNEILESRNSISGVRMRRSSSPVQEVTSSFKNAVMGKIGGSSEFVRELERENLDGKW